MPGYEKVQFIAHAIHTGCRRSPDAEYTYVGLPDPAEDVTQRLRMVEAVLSIAWDRAEKKHDTLKVFVMPEFFFRGMVGAYLMGRPEIDQLIGGLQQTVRDAAEWRDWFFVFGTAVGMSVPENGRFEGYNFALCQGGGFGDGPQAGPEAAHAVVKEMKSDIDFIVDADRATDRDWLRGRYGVLADQIGHLPPANRTGSEVQTRPYGGEGVFTHDSLVWGIEICLDHMAGRLRRSTGLPNVDLQVVPSCGMGLNAPNVVVRDGFVFNCDGLNDDGFSVLRGGAHTTLWHMRDAERQVRAPERVELGAALPALPVGRLFADGAGELHVYPLQPLP